jgi:hypothetical protein
MSSTSSFTTKSFINCWPICIIRIRIFCDN